MTEFVRFPSTPYLIRPRGVDVRDDKVFSDDERAEFLSHPLHVEEKIDGQNLGISVSADGELQFQARGSYVQPGGRHFGGLASWVAPRRQRLIDGLGPGLILFGEWCTVEHSVRYDLLPDWFLAFDVYDRQGERFWEPDVRDALVEDLALFSVPFVGTGRYELAEITAMLQRSNVGSEPMEGVVARTVDPEGRQRRAKMVRSDFVQQIDQHWMSGTQSRNRLATSSEDYAQGSSVR